MATPADQHDTLALTRPVHSSRVEYPSSPVCCPPPATDPPGAPPVPPGSAWSQLPPFLIPVAPTPVVLRNNAAVVGATLGSVSLFLAVIPLIGVVAWVLAPIGLVTSIVGLIVGVSRRAGRVGAVFGVLTSGAALLICCAWVALILFL